MYYDFSCTIMIIKGLSQKVKVYRRLNSRIRHIYISSTQPGDIFYLNFRVIVVLLNSFKFELPEIGFTPSTIAVHYKDITKSAPVNIQ